LPSKAVSSPFQGFATALGGHAAAPGPRGPHLLQPSGAGWTACKGARGAGAAAPVNAGTFGCHLHRQLVALGVRNLVVQPQDRDERGKGVKTDRIDALALCRRLNRYVRGQPQGLQRGAGAQ